MMLEAAYTAGERVKSGCCLVSKPLRGSRLRSVQDQHPLLRCTSPAMVSRADRRVLGILHGKNLGLQHSGRGVKLKVSGNEG